MIVLRETLLSQCKGTVRRIYCSNILSLCLSLFNPLSQCKGTVGHWAGYLALFIYCLSVCLSLSLSRFSCLYKTFPVNTKKLLCTLYFFSSLEYKHMFFCSILDCFHFFPLVKSTYICVPLQYSGLWFDIESVPNEYQHTKKCVTQNYTWNGKFVFFPLSLSLFLSSSFTRVVQSVCVCLPNCSI